MICVYQLLYLICLLFYDNVYGVDSLLQYVQRNISSNVSSLCRAEDVATTNDDGEPPSAALQQGKLAPLLSVIHKMLFTIVN